MKHRPPVGVPLDSWYFLTLCAKDRGVPFLIRDEVSRSLLEGIRQMHCLGKWRIYVALLMPDHVHMLVHFPEILNMGKTIGDWKRYTTRAVGVVWQKDFFDHRLRGEESAESKREYILQNPVRAGLVATPLEWVHQWSPSEVIR